MSLHPIFAQVLNSHARVTETVAPKADTYRGWSISWDYGRFTATGPNYDVSWEGEEDGWVATGGAVEASTREALIEEIDAWIEEHGA